VGRWLFDDLEQGVEASGGNHVSLVEDEDFVAVAGRSKGGTFAQIAGIVNTVVAGGVDFDDIHAATAVARQFDAAWALATRSVGWALGAVQATSQDASRGSFTAAARTRKEVSVVDAVAAKGSH
jgi:hypothetical protein